MIDVQIKLAMADTIVNVSDQALEEALTDAIREQVAYVMRDQINMQLREWISQALEEKKEQVLKSLTPEIERLTANIRLATR
jgi:hypothetical protein